MSKSIAQGNFYDTSRTDLAPHLNWRFWEAKTDKITQNMRNNKTRVNIQNNYWA